MEINFITNENGMKHYDYEWGRITIINDENNDQTYYELTIKNYEAFSCLFEDCSIFMVGDRYGAKDKDGNGILPCVFDQVERMKSSIYGRLGKSYFDIQLYGGSSTIKGIYSPDGDFVENGKHGWREEGKVIIPAEYDSIWNDGADSNFFQLCKDGKYIYVDKDMNPVLTNIRDCGKYDSTVPFPFHPHKKDVLTMQVYVGHPVAEDSNVVLLDGVWQRLDRITCDEICEMFVCADDELPMTNTDLEVFNSDFSYEYSAYKVVSTEPNGIVDCLKKLQSMDLHSNSWFYIVKVWKAMGEEPTAEELRFLRHEIEVNQQLGVLHFALGHDSSLKKGETRMVVVTHYNERCFPAPFEYDWDESVKTRSLPDLKKAHRKVLRAINKKVFPQYRKEVIQDQWNWSISNMQYSKLRNKKDTLEVMEWLSKYDKYCKKSVLNIVKDYAYNVFCTIKGIKRSQKFQLFKLQWVLDHGGDVNMHKDGKTALDIVRNEMYYYDDENITDEIKSTIADMKGQCETMLLHYGAKTYDEIIEEESQNNDYKVELQKMA